MPTDNKSAGARHNEEYLTAFLSILVKLEGAGESVGLVYGSGDEEREEAGLRHWADLRAQQNRFAAAEGLMLDL